MQNATQNATRITTTIITGPVLVTPLHHYYRPSHLEKVIQEMQRLGPPVLRAYFDEVVDAWYAREGTHRLRAAKILDFVPVLVPVRWQRNQDALTRCRFATSRFAHLFRRVEIDAKHSDAKHSDAKHSDAKHSMVT